MIAERWGVFDRDGNNELMEGGFFSEDAARTACQEWNDSYCVEHFTITGPYYVAPQSGVKPVGVVNPLTSP